MCFSKCFLTRKRGRGSAAGAAEDHTSIQHSLETIALQPFSFKRASRSFANTGSFLLFFGRLFSRAFSAGRQHEIFQFSCVFGSLEGGLFGVFWDFLPFSCENGDPPFLHTLTAFWLDFYGLGPPRITKNP